MVEGPLKFPSLPLPGRPCEDVGGDEGDGEVEIEAEAEAEFEFEVVLEVEPEIGVEDEDEVGSKDDG